VSWADGGRDEDPVVSQDTGKFRYGPHRIGGVVEHVVGHHHVERAVVVRYLLDIGLACLERIEVREPCHARAGHADHAR
jgi:hypothetical protein